MKISCFRGKLTWYFIGVYIIKKLMFCNRSGSVTRDHLDNSTSEEPTIPTWDFRIQWFIIDIPLSRRHSITDSDLNYVNGIHLKSLLCTLYTCLIPYFVFFLLLDCSSYLSQENYRIEELRVNWINIWNSSVVLVWSRNTILVSSATIILVFFFFYYDRVCIDCVFVIIIICN